MSASSTVTVSQSQNTNSQPNNGCESYGTLFDQNHQLQSAMSEQFEEMLDGMNQRSASPNPLDSGSQNLLHILNDPRAMIPLPAPHMPHPVCIESGASSADYEEIKAFLRWNSDTEIGDIPMDTNSYTTSPITNDSSSTNDSSFVYAASGYSSTSGNSNNLMPSPPTTTTSPGDSNLSQLSSQMQFTYDPHSLVMQPEAYFGFTGYEEPRYSSNALHGFELMTDHAFYGYSSDPVSTFSNGYYPLSLQDQNTQQQFPTNLDQHQPQNLGYSIQSNHHQQQHQQPQQHQQQQQQQQLQQQQQNKITASKAFRWAAAAAANANTPTSHISLSMIVPQQSQDQPQSTDDSINSNTSITAATTTTTKIDSQQTNNPLNQFPHHPLSTSKTTTPATTKSSNATTTTGGSLSSSFTLSNSAAIRPTLSSNNINKTFSPYKKSSSKSKSQLNSLSNSNNKQKLSSTNTTSSGANNNCGSSKSSCVNTVGTKRGSNFAVTPSSLSSYSSQGGPTKVVRMEHLESQQKWFKAQIAEHAERRSRRDIERGGMIAALLRIAGNGNSGSNTGDKAEK